MAIGIPVLILCVITSVVSVILYRKEKYSWTLLFIILTGFVLRAYVSSDQQLFSWDERYHALVSKNLTKHPFEPTLYDNPVLPYEYNNWVANHIWIEKGPVPLWAMASSIYFLGATEISLRLPSLIISLLAVYLTFLIGTNLFNKKTGLLAAFFHTIHGTLIEVSGGRLSSDHVETFFSFFIELGILLAIISIVKNKGIWFSALIGAATACAILCKWAPALIVFPVWIFAELFAKKHSLLQIFLRLFIALLTCFLIVVPWLWHLHSAYPAESTWIFKKFLVAYDETVEMHKGPWWFYFQNLGMVYGELIWLPVILSVYCIIKKKAGWKMIMLNLWWMIPFIIFSLGATKRPTYLLLSAPAVFVILSYYCFCILEYDFKRKWLKPVLLILLVGLPVRYSIERTKIFTHRDRNPQWAIDLKQMKNKYDKRTIFFNEPHAIEAMFYTDYVFYVRKPTKHEMKDLENKGYLVVVKE